MNKQVITRPVISEKSFAAEEKGKYIFRISPDANKNLVKKNVEAMFKVKVDKVNIVSIPGKKKRVGRIYGKRNDIKKAIVTLKKGEKIKEFK
ncbi:MAG: 50S ribosomal protein L23 [Patescibacteria group bacterium]|nr:50S ribosomal protein L23 [Patescibacteria group bacterium]